MFVYNSLMDTDSSTKYKIRKRKAALNVSFCVKKERDSVYQKVSSILQKPTSERSADDVDFLKNSEEVVQQITQRKAQRQKVKDRAQEFEDAPDVLAEKCKILAEAVINSNHLVVYTGAGISTAACIPDYRGSNGIWTLLQQGKDIGLHDLSRAEPTLTHMALYGLYRSGILKHVVSQNCDGLHLRSGMPRTILSEVHGNMYLEVCTKCKPCNHYLRLFDVTENTARYSHETLRLCYKCGNPLKDTIVHFGERGKLQWPLNWEVACKQADKADVILCLGSSLKVLKKYPWLWCMDKPVKKRPKLYIVNLQWTPKDDHSTLKINGKCDVVIQQMMSHLGLSIPEYVRDLDPIFYHATHLHELELHTTTRSPIEKTPQVPEEQNNDEVENCRTGKIGSTPEHQQEADDNVKKSMCSSPQDINCSNTSNNNNNKITRDDDENNDARATDLITSNLLLISTEIKKEIITDTYSDKENDVNMTSEVKTEPVSDINDENEVDIDYRSDADGQSNLSVINEKLKLIIPEVVAPSEKQIAIKVDSSDDHAIDELNRTSILAQQSSTAVSTVDMYEGMHFLFGRNLWSDLSLFDALTHQPLLFNHSVFSWPGMNAYSSLIPYYENQTRLINHHYDLLNAVQNASSDRHQNNKSECSTSSSIGTRRRGDIRTNKIDCGFCHKYYDSANCLFYSTFSSNTPFSAISACLCCGGEDEEDEQEEEEDNNPDKTPAKVPNVNPGWFGKGYRKKIKKRK